MVSLEKNILPVIESVYGSLTHLEKKIADYFLSDEALTADHRLRRCLRSSMSLCLL